MAKTISFVKGKGSIRHNNRGFTASNVDGSRSSMNISYVTIPIEEAYEQIFGPAVADYNAKQKRNDRKIDNYLQKIKTSKNNEKVFYETVVQIGKKDDTGILDEDGNITDAALLAKEVLDEYARTFQERNPNLILFNAVLHMDEATPHLHLDYIPVAHGYKTGLSTRNSLTKGLQEMGIAKAAGKNDNETMHWQQRERDHISELCKARGIETEVLGIVRDDYSIPEYKAAMREVEAAVAEIEILSQEKEEIVSVLEESEIMYDKTTKAISEQETVLEDINDQIREAEQKRTQRLNEMSNIINAGKYAANEAQEITESAKEVKPVFGGEPMVKISRKKFDKIVEKYKMARTFERLYKDYYGKCSAQELTIQSLRQTIADLTSKVRQFTNFIESKGLVAAFKEFLQPKPKSVIKTLRDNQEKVKTKDEQVRKLKPEIKKKRSAVR
jgi:hypothetical protein